MFVHAYICANKRRAELESKQDITADQDVHPDWERSGFLTGNLMFQPGSISSAVGSLGLSLRPLRFQPDSMDCKAGNMANHPTCIHTYVQLANMLSWKSKWTSSLIQAGRH